MARVRWPAMALPFCRGLTAGRLESDPRSSTAPGGRQPTSYNQVDGDLFVDIRALMPGELRAAATTLAHSMRDNPLHVKVFGSDPDRRQRRLLGFLGPPGCLHPAECTVRTPRRLTIQRQSVRRCDLWY
ncbi:hypothetical protein Nham_0919 [Nitrobacter hamburgensis X14]|uniref:Uncharacterized protein n=1 Tax=Nitrobacter hamburgensis (strain DSM 10229 / NCIMB 13809 / X14) TaxID=323097 RepID=Q1QPS0_NITHX|nr:hypothetical protein Nham_0919 [Nitrobacter hamburgensis X14]